MVVTSTQFALILFAIVVIIVTILILRWPFGESDTDDLRTVVEFDFEAQSDAPLEQSNSDQPAGEFRSTEPHTEFATPEQREHFGGGFGQDHEKQRDEAFPWTDDTEQPRLDNTQDWSLPPDEKEDEEDGDSVDYSPTGKPESENGSDRDSTTPPAHLSPSHNKDESNRERSDRGWFDDS